MSKNNLRGIGRKKLASKLMSCNGHYRLVATTRFSREHGSLRWVVAVVALKLTAYWSEIRKYAILVVQYSDGSVV